MEQRKIKPQLSKPHSIKEKIYVDQIKGITMMRKN